MLSKILSRKTCASCKFCCSFRRQSLWETRHCAYAHMPDYRRNAPAQSDRTCKEWARSKDFRVRQNASLHCKEIPRRFPDYLSLALEPEFLRTHKDQRQEQGTPWSPTYRPWHHRNADFYAGGHSCKREGTFFS